MRYEVIFEVYVLYLHLGTKLPTIGFQSTIFAEGTAQNAHTVLSKDPRVCTIIHMHALFWDLRLVGLLHYNHIFLTYSVHIWTI